MDPVSRIAVKFRPSVALPYERGAQRAFQKDDAERWRDIESRSDGALEPLFDLPHGALDRLLERALKSKEIDVPHLKGWFTLGCSRPAAADLTTTLRKWPSVETAYVMPDGPPPFTTVAFADDPIESAQRFHLDAPEGLDIRYAWRHAGGNGDGVNVMLVDRTFDLSHADLSHPVDWPFGPGDVTLAFGEAEPNTSEPQHGAAALAVIMARDNDLGGVGMVPMARAAGYSAFDSRRVPIYSTARAVAAAASVNPYFDLGRDVIVIELGFTESLDDENPDPRTPVDLRPMLPAEAEPATFDAIQTAVAAGIVVVEGAGNSDLDLDRFRRNGKFPMDRTSPDFRDSGAIMVSAAFSGGGTPRGRIVRNRLIPGTTRREAVAQGNRIDCFAWGDGVMTGLVAAGSIGNTSAAAAIVGGAVASLQGIAERHDGSRLPPLRVRELLSDPRLNTPSFNPPADRIGVMPDLRRVLREGLGIRPRIGLILRDFSGDTGIPSPEVVLGRSPDITVTLTEREDPQQELGSAEQNGLPVALADPCFIYLRARNLGTARAVGIRADVFWTGIDDVLDPSRWHRIGTASFPEMQPHPTDLTVSSAVRWNLTEAGSPGIQGPYMLIAVITNDWDDPMPAVTGPFPSLQAFREFVGRHAVIATRRHTLYAMEESWWRRSRWGSLMMRLVRLVRG